MVRSAVFAAVLALLSLAAPVTAHPAPFTYLDIYLQGSTIELSLVAHVFDVAHDIGLQQPEQLLDNAVLRDRGPAFAALLRDRLRLAIDGRDASISPWQVVEPLPDRQGIRLSANVIPASTSPPGIIDITALLFPYDTVHQTFVNVHERDVVVSQSILDAVNRTTRYYAGTTAGGWAAAQLMAGRGFAHVFSSPEHVVLLLGLVLLGASRGQALTMVGALVAGNLLALGLAMFAFVSPPARFIDPAMALAIVYLGTDNLMARGGRDVRTWIALACGVIHGFSLPAMLRSMSLSPTAEVWSLAALHVGLAAAQVLVVAAVIAAIRAVRRYVPGASGYVALAGSIFVIALGTLWFVQRVFFPAAVFPGLMARG